MSTQSSSHRDTSPESSPEHGYANAPGPHQVENDDVVFLLSVPRRCRLHPRGPQTAGPSSSGGAVTNPIVVSDDEDTPSTEEARATNNVITISDDEDKQEKQPNIPPSVPSTNSNTRARAQPTTSTSNTISSSIIIKDSNNKTPTTSIPQGSNKRERSPSSTNPPATRPRHQ